MGRILLAIVHTLVNISLTLLVFVAIIPVIDLPLATAVPQRVWLWLAGLDLVLIIALYLPRRTAKRIAYILLGFLLIIAAAVILSQKYAATPPISGTNSVASLEKVELGGTQQWITIRGQDSSKPVLLYLGIGGPGAGGFPANNMTLRPLEEHFVVVNWDQPGTGKSYYAAPFSNLTVDKYIADAHQLTGMLRSRFHQEKIYVLGLSWGTILGTKLVQQYPEDYYAYIGNGQMVNTLENDRLGYNLALQLAIERGDARLAKRLKGYGEPPYTGPGMALKYAAYNNVLFDYMGSSSLQTVLLLAPQLSREYGLLDKINFGRGLLNTFPAVYPQLRDLDFTTQAAELRVPVYFLAGRQDVNAMASLVERYFYVLQAPYKELIWLESGHGAGPEELRDALVDHVLVTSPPR